MPIETHVYSGSVVTGFRKATEIHIYDGSAWRDCDEVHIYDGSTWRKVFEKPSQGAEIGGDWPSGVDGGPHWEDENDVCGTIVDFSDNGQMTISEYHSGSTLYTYDYTTNAPEDSTNLWIKWTDANGNGDSNHGPGSWPENTYVQVDSDDLRVRVLDWNSGVGGTYDTITFTIAEDNSGTGAQSKAIQLGGNYYDPA